MSDFAKKQGDLFYSLLEIARDEDQREALRRWYKWNIKEMHIGFAISKDLQERRRADMTDYKKYQIRQSLFELASHKDFPHVFEKLEEPERENPEAHYYDRYQVSILAVRL